MTNQLLISGTPVVNVDRFSSIDLVRLEDAPRGRSRRHPYGR
jgi:hypothetical protein